MAFTCCNKCNGTTLSVIAGVIIGIITALFRITAIITVTPAFLWVLFGIGIGYLGLQLAVAPLVQRESSCECFCNILTTVLAGILGTVLLSVVLLAIPFAVTSIVGAILTGALLFFFTLVVAATASFVKCIVGCN
jgi:hypothetical protein